MSFDPRDNFEMTAALADTTKWLITQGLENRPASEWLESFCERLVAAGIPLQRVAVTLRAHHPEIGAFNVRWHAEDGSESETFQRSVRVGDDYRNSPLYYLMANPISELRQRLDVPDPEHEFPIFPELRARGATDYFALKRFFVRSDHTATVDPVRGAEGMTMTLTTAVEGGFTDLHLNAIREIAGPLCLTLKALSNRAMAEDITAAYLGADASTRVLSGAISRGYSETISAVIWYFDLANFTKMSESHSGEAIIELLNDYFGEVVALVEAAGGNVLKFMGDGMLAIFDLDQVANARAVAIEAAAALPALFDKINARREAEGLPTTDFTLGLHAGDVLYGNIGGRKRLDFTVIGSAVNTTARILGMSGPLDQRIVISSAVAGDLVDQRPDLVSLGHYRLRGVTERQELFTLD